MFEPKGSQAGIVFLAFSVIVITENTNSFELVVITQTGVSPSTNPTLYANSSKFNFRNDRSSFLTFHFFQWISGQSGGYSGVVNYWARIRYS